MLAIFRLMNNAGLVAAIQERKESHHNWSSALFLKLVDMWSCLAVCSERVLEIWGWLLWDHASPLANLVLTEDI